MIASVAILMANGFSASSSAVRAQKAAAERTMAEQRALFEAAKPKAAPEQWDASRKDFWNDPRRWDGVDPNVECFWMVRRRDVIDVRESPKAAPNPYTNAWPHAYDQRAAPPASMLQQAMTSQFNAYPAQGGIFA